MKAYNSCRAYKNMMNYNVWALLCYHCSYNCYNHSFYWRVQSDCLINKQFEHSVLFVPKMYLMALYTVHTQDLELIQLFFTKICQVLFK